MSKLQPNLDLVRAMLIKNRFVTVDLRPSIFVLALKDKKKENFIVMIKNSRLILEFVNKNLHLLLINKSAAKIWAILKNCF